MWTMAINRNLIGRLSLAALVLTGILWLLLNRERLEMDALAAWISGFGLLAPLIFVASRAAGAVVFVPGSLMALTAGALALLPRTLQQVFAVQPEFRCIHLQKTAQRDDLDLIGEAGLAVGFGDGQADADQKIGLFAVPLDRVKRLDCRRMALPRLAQDGLGVFDEQIDAFVRIEHLDGFQRVEHLIDPDPLAEAYIAIGGGDQGTGRHRRLDEGQVAMALQLAAVGFAQRPQETGHKSESIRQHGLGVAIQDRPFIGLVDARRRDGLV